MTIEVMNRAGSVASTSDGQKRPYVSIVAPCYNEQESLGEFHRRVSEVCRKECGDDYEIVLVNDGSRDSTWPMMCAFAEKDKHIVAVGLSRNHGHQLALTAGLNVCRGERILILDADLQDPPELLGDMLRLMDQGNDVVYGQRARARAKPGSRRQRPRRSIACSIAWSMSTCRWMSRNSSSCRAARSTF